MNNASMRLENNIPQMKGQDVTREITAYYIKAVDSYIQDVNQARINIEKFIKSRKEKR